jgi:hypothetical protein
MGFNRQFADLPADVQQHWIEVADEFAADLVKRGICQIVSIPKTT